MKFNKHCISEQVYWVVNEFTPQWIEIMTAWRMKKYHETEQQALRKVLEMHKKGKE